MTAPLCLNGLSSKSMLALSILKPSSIRQSCTHARSLQRPGPASRHSYQPHRLLCRSNGDSLQALTDKQKISIDLEPQAEGEYCMPGEVLLDNESHEQFTILRVEVKDYPGLLRVIAWVLNGLQLTVQNARCRPAGYCILTLLQVKAASSM